MDESKFTIHDYKTIKKSIFFDFIIDYSIDLLILRKKTKLCIDNGWKYLLKSYKYNLYFYTGLFYALFVRTSKKIGLSL